jgi:hypothetical protein
MFLCDVIFEHCCDLSKDLEGQATVEPLPLSSHLQRSLSSRLVTSIIGNSSRSDLFISVAMPCMISIAQSDILMAYSRRPNIPRASRIPSADALPSRAQDVQQ